MVRMGGERRFASLLRITAPWSLGITFILYIHVYLVDGLSTNAYVLVRKFLDGYRRELLWRVISYVLDLQESISLLFSICSGRKLVNLNAKLVIIFGIQDVIGKIFINFVL